MAKKDASKKTAAELRKEAADLIAMADEKEAEEARAAADRVASLEEAQMRTARVVEDLQWLYAKKRLNPKTVEKFTTPKGIFAAHLFFKRPKA